MKFKSAVGLLVSFAVAAGLIFGGANAQSTSGEIPYTGHPVMDVNVKTLNIMIADVKANEDLAKVYEQKPKKMKELRDRQQEVSVWRSEIEKSLVGLEQKRYKLDQDRQSSIQLAGSDSKKVEEIEAEYARRTAELDQSKLMLEQSKAKLIDINANLQLAAKTLEQAMTVEDWNGATGSGGLRALFSKQMSSLSDRLKELEKIYSEASKLASSGSILDSKTESYSAYRLEVQLVEANPGMEFYVNGQKVEKSSIIAVGADRKVQVRALLLGARRQQSRDLLKNPPESAILDGTPNDYSFSYSMGALSSKWEVESEEYTWAVIKKTERPLAQTTQTSNPGNSKKGAVKNDLMLMTFMEGTATETVTIDVSAKMSWKLTGSRAGKDVAETVEESGTGKLVIQIYPA